MKMEMDEKQEEYRNENGWKSRKVGKMEERRLETIEISRMKVF